MVALGVALLAGACDNPVDEGEEHGVEPVGLVIETEQGSSVVTVENGDVTGRITVAAGSETDHLHVHFLDDEGGEVDPGDDHYLEGSVADEAIAGIEQHTPGEFEIHVVGIAPGETMLQLEWMHGAVGSGHAHYTSPEIPVTVTP